MASNTLSIGFGKTIKVLNSQVVCTVVTKEGQTFDCLVFVGSNEKIFFYINQSSLSGQLKSISFDRGNLKSVFTLKPDGIESYQTF